MSATCCWRGARRDSAKWPFERHWAEWFAVISAGLYIPLEIYHLWHRPSPLAGIIFLTNVIIVVYLGRLLAADHRRKKAAQALREKV